MLLGNTLQRRITLLSIVVGRYASTWISGAGSCTGSILIGRGIGHCLCISIPVVLEQAIIVLVTVTLLTVREQETFPDLIEHLHSSILVEKKHTILYNVID